MCVPLPVTTRKWIRPACTVLPPITPILPPPTCTVTVGMPARVLAPAAVPPTTTAAPSDAAVTAAAPSAKDFLNLIVPPFEYVMAAACCSKGRTGDGAIQGVRAELIKPATACSG